jgi:hypothetical protein
MSSIIRMQEKIKVNKSLKIAAHLKYLRTAASCNILAGIKATWDS